VSFREFRLNRKQVISPATTPRRGTPRFQSHHSIGLGVSVVVMFHRSILRYLISDTIALKLLAGNYLTSDKISIPSRWNSASSLTNLNIQISSRSVNTDLSIPSARNLASVPLSTQQNCDLLFLLLDVHHIFQNVSHLSSIICPVPLQVGQADTWVKNSKGTCSAAHLTGATASWAGMSQSLALHQNRYKTSQVSGEKCVEFFAAKIQPSKV